MGESSSPQLVVHPTAIVDDDAVLGNVTVGPFAVIGAGVTLTDGVEVGSHAVIEGPTSVGPRTRIGHHAVIGTGPQDLRHDGSETSLEIGADNVFREFVTVHRGSSTGSGTTRIGDGNYFMANSHVAHDCEVGDRCVLANSVALAGDVTVGDGVVFGGLAAVHQHARIGRLAMVGGGAMCAQDVPPFTIANGDRARLYGLNIVGLRRAGFDSEVLATLKDAWRTLFVSGLPRRTAMARVQDRLGSVELVAELLAFLNGTDRGVCRAAVK